MPLALRIALASRSHKTLVGRCKLQLSNAARPLSVVILTNDGLQKRQQAPGTHCWLLPPGHSWVTPCDSAPAILAAVGRLSSRHLVGDFLKTAFEAHSSGDRPGDASLARLALDYRGWLW